ncbi:MAG: Sapep family Mn(2+)-dependent dipeptidase, partial [Anaerovoracaceae bacterium]
DEDTVDEKDEKRFFLEKLKGGIASNMVADWAKAQVKGHNKAAILEAKNKIESLAAEKKYDISIELLEGVNTIKVSTKGISAHGSTPEKGVNAISIMFELLGEINFACDNVNKGIEFYNEHIGFIFNGSKIGCNLVDEPSGELSFNVGLVRLEKGKITITVNARFPVTFKEEDVYKGMDKVVKAYGYEVIPQDYIKPIYFPVDNPIIVTLMEVYQKFTGDYENKPIVMGGATFARAIPNAVAFGALFPGEGEYEHQKNERASVDNLIKSTKIYAEAIMRLTGE